MGGLVRLMATLAGMGVKAYKAGKRKSRRKRLGLPEKTKMEQRSSNKVKKSASDFGKRRKQLGGLSKGKPDFVKQSGPSKKEVIGYGTAAGAGLGATSIIKKRMKKKKK